MDEATRLLKSAFEYLEHGEIPQPPEHSCGPESYCDGDCMDFAYFVKDLSQIRQFLEKGESPVKDNRILVSFLYELMRDYVTPGVVEQILQHSLPENGENLVTQFSNKHLVKYAQELADRMGVESH